MPIEWPVPLKHRRGSSTRLGGVDVYFDFDWKKVFEHDRSAFPNGQSLSRLVTRDCPENKVPTLLLTAQEDAGAEIREVEDRYIVIVPILEYLATAGADAASTYYARLSGTPLTRLTSLSDVTFTVGELTRFLEANLSEAVLERWAAASPDRREMLQGVIGAPGRPEAGDLPGALRGLDTLDTEILQAVVEHVERTSSSDGNRELVVRLTASVSGRRAVIDVLGTRLPDRIQDVRQEIEAYDELIAGRRLSPKPMFRSFWSQPRGL